MNDNKQYALRGIKERLMFKKVFYPKRPDVKYNFTDPDGFDYYDFKLASGITTNERYYYGEIKVREYELNLFNEWIIEAKKIVELQKLQHNKLVMNIHYDGYRLWDVSNMNMNYVGDYVKPNELYKYSHGDIVKMEFVNSTVEDKGERWKDVVVLKNKNQLECGSHWMKKTLIDAAVDNEYKMKYGTI